MRFTGDEPVQILKTLRWQGEIHVIIAAPPEHFRDLYQLIAGETHIRLARASSPINSKRRRGIYDSIRGTRGPFSAAAAAMVVVSVVSFVSSQAWKLYEILCM
jgi:hypothetical protein